MSRGGAGPTLVITNDYPPRIGGIESFVSAVTRMLQDDVVVLTSHHRDQADWCAPHPVHRGPTPTLLPGPDLARRASALLASSGARRVLFGAAAPLALITPALRAAGAERVVALTHGHEVWWARTPLTRAALHRIAAQVDHLGYVSEATRRPIAAAVGPAAAGRMIRLPPPVRTELFHPPPSRSGRAGETRSGGPPMVLAAGRMVHRKGIDTLLSAWREVLRHWTGDVPPRLVLAGDGPQRESWQRRSHRWFGPDRAPRWCGAVPHQQMPALMAAADVFALPVRTRFAGLSPEGLGLVFAEAAASGLPVLVGRSGGAPETVRAGVSGHVLDPQDPSAWAEALLVLLRDGDRRRAMGEHGRELVGRRFSYDHGRAVLRAALNLP